jgi:hypothetical protein
MTTGIESTIAVVHAGLGFFGLGVAKQDKAHGVSIDLLSATV